MHVVWSLHSQCHTIASAASRNCAQPCRTSRPPSPAGLSCRKRWPCAADGGCGKAWPCTWAASGDHTDSEVDTVIMKTINRGCDEFAAALMAPPAYPHPHTERWRIRPMSRSPKAGSHQLRSLVIEARRHRRCNAFGIVLKWCRSRVPVHSEFAPENGESCVQVNSAPVAACHIGMDWHGAGRLAPGAWTCAAFGAWRALAPQRSPPPRSGSRPMLRAS